jgi:hypothetical protein
MRAIEKRCADANIDFSATDSCMHCMLHMVHLAAIKVVSIYRINHLRLTFFQLLEGIGMLSKVDTKKVLSRSSNYQDNTLTPMDCEYNNKVVQLDNEEELEDQDLSSNNSIMIISAIAKVISMALLCYCACCSYLNQPSYRRSFSMSGQAHNNARNGIKKYMLQ